MNIKLAHLGFYFDRKSTSFLIMPDHCSSKNNHPIPPSFLPFISNNRKPFLHLLKYLLREFYYQMKKAQVLWLRIFFDTRWKRRVFHHKKWVSSQIFSREGASETENCHYKTSEELGIPRRCCIFSNLINEWNLVGGVWLFKIYVFLGQSRKWVRLWRGGFICKSSKNFGWFQSPNS